VREIIVTNLGRPSSRAAALLAPQVALARAPH